MHGSKDPPWNLQRVRRADEDLIERIDADLRNILAMHRPEPMPEAMHKELGAILEKFGSD